MDLPARYGHYDLLERIAVGGMGEIFRAKYAGLAGFERACAIKRILPHLSDDEEFADRLINEAKIAVQLSHANIVQIYELGKIEDEYFIAMEWVDGPDLATLQVRAKAKDMPMPVPLAIHIIHEVARALEHAHKKTDAEGHPLGIVHRDVSPQNVLISQDGAVKLGDFGIARAGGIARQFATNYGAVLGKRRYMSPEQRKGQAVDARADVYSLGALLHEAVAGESPDPEEVPKPLADLVKDLPEGLADLCMRALEPDPAKRLPDAQAMVEGLDIIFMRMAALPGGIRDPAPELARYVQKVCPPGEKRPQRRSLTSRMRDAMRPGIGEKRGFTGSVIRESTAVVKGATGELKTGEFIKAGGTASGISAIGSASSAGLSPAVAAQIEAPALDPLPAPDAAAPDREAAGEGEGRSTETGPAAAAASAASPVESGPAEAAVQQNGSTAAERSVAGLGPAVMMMEEVRGEDMTGDYLPAADRTGNEGDDDLVEPDLPPPPPPDGATVTLVISRAMAERAPPGPDPITVIAPRPSGRGTVPVPLASSVATEVVPIPKPSAPTEVGPALSLERPREVGRATPGRPQRFPMATPSGRVAPKIEPRTEVFEPPPRRRSLFPAVVAGVAVGALLVIARFAHLPAAGTPEETPIAIATPFLAHATPRPSLMAVATPPTTPRPKPTHVVVVATPRPRPTATPRPTPKPLPAGEATLEIAAVPWANMTVDGNPTGNMPTKIKVAPGQHKVVFENPKLGTRVREINVRANENYKVIVDFTHPE